jgi:hypothetical protein
VVGPPIDVGKPVAAGPEGTRRDKVIPCPGWHHAGVVCFETDPGHCSIGLRPIRLHKCFSFISNSLRFVNYQIKPS